MAAPREYSGRGFILGGVTDETPDWLGSYEAGFEGAQRQQETSLRKLEAKQRMGQSAAEEARRAQRFGWDTADRLREEEAWATTDSTLPGLQTQPGPAFGPMDPVNLPPAQAPSPGLIGGNASNQPVALTRDQFVKMLPEWAGLESQAGLPPGFLERTAMLESSNGTNFREGSQYIGIFQIGNAVAKDFGVTPEQLKDPRINAQVAAKLAARNLRQLREGLGREPQPWELYLAHQQGAGGALALLRSPNQSAVEALTAAHGGDRAKAIEIITANGGNPQMTAGQFAQVWASKYGGGVTGAPGLSGGPAVAGPNAFPAYEPNPQESPVEGYYRGAEADATKRSALQTIEGQLTWGASSSPIMDFGRQFLGTIEGNEQLAASKQQNAAALEWYRSPGVQEWLLSNPQALTAATENPLAFYQQYKDQAIAAPTSAPSEKGDLPAGLITDTPAYQAPAATGQVTINANGVPVTGAPAAPQQAGLPTEPAVLPPSGVTGEVMPRVSRDDFAGLQQPGQGSIGQQIMRTPAGQQAVLPDMGAYLVEPAKIGADLFEMQQMRAALERDYAEAVRFRDRATMMEIRNKAVQIDAATRMLTNLQSVAKMQAGDDNAMAQELSRMTGGRLRIQPVQPNGTYNVFYDGRMIYENVSKDAFMAALRSEFDAQYQAQVAELKKLRDERETKLFEGQIEESKEITKQTADMHKLIAVEVAKAGLRPDEYNFSVVGDYVYAIPKSGGAAKVFTMAPDTDIYGQPTDRMVLKEYGTQSAVPVQ